MTFDCEGGLWKVTKTYRPNEYAKEFSMLLNKYYIGEGWEPTFEPPDGLKKTVLVRRPILSPVSFLCGRYHNKSYQNVVRRSITAKWWILRVDTGPDTSPIAQVFVAMLKPFNVSTETRHSQAVFTTSTDDWWQAEPMSRWCIYS